MTQTRSPVEVVEIVQPLCSRTFGVSPCNATGTPCYNTDFTCKFRSALDMTDSLSLQFVEPNANTWVDDQLELATEVDDIITTEGDDPILLEYRDAFQAAMAIPALTGYRSAPTSLNVAGGSQSKTPLGYRAVANASIKDFPWNDVDTDPYRTQRTYDPQEQGTFWTKWLARNPFHVGYLLRRYEGLEGQPLDEMIKREYVVEKIDHGRDGVSITAKDVLRRITENRTTAPRLTAGALSTDITDTAVTFEVAGGTFDDYPGVGFARIGSEIVGYDGLLLDGGTGNIIFTNVTRAQLGSEASGHSQFDVVQRVVSYVNQPFTDIIYDLLVTYGGIDPSYITKANWDAEFAVWRPTFSFTAHLTKPERVEDLLGELCLQAQTNLWWDERTQQIILRAQRPDFTGATLTDDANIIAGSYSVKEKPEERVSQVWTYYNIRNWADDPKDKSKYSRAAVRIDVDKQIQYGGEVATREITSRWISTENLATNLTLSYLQRFKDVRREITFDLSAQDGTTYWTGDGVNIQHFLDVDIHGAPKVANWLITSAEATIPNGRYRFTAEDNGTSGVLWAFVAEADYPLLFADASEDERNIVGYWLDDDGNDADGNPRSFRWL